MGVGIILIFQLVLFISENKTVLATVTVDKLNVCFVKNTFTAAAYNNAFYEFYRLHHKEVYSGMKVMKDVDLLTAKIPDNASQYHFEIFEFLPTHITQLLPSAHVSIITDADVHNGLIFKNNNTNTSTNLCDVLILGHQEYVTQQEYSNFKTFVANGGTLIITTGNVFYTEVKYNKQTNSVTLVNGHKFQFDGKTAQKGVEERWENETREWLGSNFYPKYFVDKDYHHLFNNPFNFTGEDGGEEQYYDVSNPSIKVILDYKSSDARYPIAAYELKYGKGKSIVIGLAAEDIISEPCLEACQKFVKFFDGLMLNHVVPAIRSGH